MATLTFVPLTWAEAVPLRGTPTTLLLANRTLIWSHLGALDPDSAKALMATMVGLRGIIK